MSTPKAITDILTWQHAHQGDVRYSETADTRLASDTAHLTSATDCSGMAIRMLKHFGGPVMQTTLKNATYTGNLCQLGTHITSSHAEAAAGQGMLPGDLIFFTWDGHNATYDHVAIYAGNGRIWNHGGPGNGPLDWSLSDNVHAASEVQVRRYIDPTHPLPGPTPAPLDLLEEIMALPGAPKTYAEFLSDVEARAAHGVLNAPVTSPVNGKSYPLYMYLQTMDARTADLEKRAAATAAAAAAGKHAAS